MARLLSETLWSREAWIFWMSVLVRSLASAGRSSLSVRWCSGKRDVKGAKKLGHWGGGIVYH